MEGRIRAGMREVTRDGAKTRMKPNVNVQERLIK